VIKDFDSFKINILIATVVGEEGLDISDVDLIICFDSGFSPVRMVQRMGRTGRKRNGMVYLLLMEGKEFNSYMKAQV
jgi:ERCC4-related helicase